MKKLKTILPFKIFILLLFTILYVYYITSNLVYKSNYDLATNNVSGIIEKIDIDGNKATIILKAKEKIIVNYYLETIIERDLFLDYKLGDYIEVFGEFTKPTSNTVFNLYNYQKYLLSKKIKWVINADKIIMLKHNNKISYKLKNYLNDRLLNLKSASYLKTFILGDSILLDSEVLTSYQVNGISHLLAISGMHITLLSQFFYFILNKLNKNTNINFILVSIFLIFYAFLTSFSPSVLRAVILFIFLNLKKIFNLKIENSTILILIACLLLIYNPYYIYNVGFLFSFIISFYLMVFSYKINKNKKYFSKILITSIIAFLASIPILINHFFNINILSIILNLLFVPLVSIVIFPFALLVMVFPFLDNIYYLLIMLLENLSLFFANIDFFNIVLCKIPFYLIIFYYLVITYTIYSSKFWLIVLCLFIHTNIRYINFNAYLTMIDVGQGDSILLELENNKSNILIDTGGLTTYITDEWQERKKEYSIIKSKTIPYLKSLGIKKINYLIITHGDYDHIGEAINLVTNFKISNIILNSGSLTKEEERLINIANEKEIPILFLSQNELKIKSYSFRFLNDIDFENENEDSLVIHTKIKDHHILFMGDTGEDTERYILEEYNIANVDILKVGHHGSRYSSSELFLDQINPNLALISAGFNNRFNHPHDEVIKRLNDRDIFSLVTSIDGSIRVNLNSFKIYTCSRVYANGC